jgi:hypothetical protein
MGFLNLISASTLSAKYDSYLQKLFLHAEGEYMEATYGISFARQQWIGGLKFNLEGWTGPITGRKKAYTYTQDFDIHLPSPVYPSSSLLIADAENREGVTVPIEWIVESPPKEKPADKPADVIQQSRLLSPREHIVKALYAEPFTISQSTTDLPKFGAIDIKYDASFLTLICARFFDGSIYWEFKPCQIGSTQVYVTIEGGIAPYTMTIIWEVLVAYPSGIGPVLPPEASSSEMVKQTVE